jgi:hypothetical protein
MKSFDAVKVNIAGEGAVPTRKYWNITSHGRDIPKIRAGASRSSERMRDGPRAFMDLVDYDDDGNDIDSDTE